eukprot:TRINITY_DN37_c0_g1_i1.p1 TRINITY_DN37_c0_g1~~TRINITY_DN37_c0_g1_i1.p1  ORF type:complete len:359 (-),score=81.73 TRINITY_DN37_c0_g1_i1:231-1307(-)
MAPPPLCIVEEEMSSASLVASSDSTDTTCQNSPGLKEHNYMGLSDCSSAESSVISSLSEVNKTSLNLKATELRLGLPGSQSPVRDPELCLLSSTKLDEKPLFSLLPSKDGIFSTSQKTNKRGFSDTMDGFSEVTSGVFAEGNWMFPTAGSESETAQSAAQGKFSVNTGKISGASSAMVKEIVPLKVSQDRKTNHNQMGPSNNNGNAPAAKAQVVGWPPIRSFRKNTLATNSKNNEEVDGRPSSLPLFVKVSMDGAPYLRKVDMRTCSTYLKLSLALEKMFSGFTIGQCGSHGVPGREMMNENKLRDLLHGSEYVLTYEDRDGDWMLVGDVPWERLRIMKSADAIGLAPRAMEKCKNRN